jgi:hypothetical protein
MRVVHIAGLAFVAFRVSFGYEALANISELNPVRFCDAYEYQTGASFKNGLNPVAPA